MILKKHFKFILIISFLLSLVIPCIQLHIEYMGYFGIGGVFVNDTNSYWTNLKSFSIDGGGGKYTSILGVLILFYPVLFLGSIYCLLTNVFLLLASFILFYKTLNQFGYKLSEDKFLTILFLVYFNFYIWGILFYPNKEIPLIFLTNLFIFLLINKKYFLNFLLIILIFFFRDAYSFICLISLVLFLVFNKYYKENPFKFILFTVLFMMFFSLKALSQYGLLNNYQYVIDRNLDLENVDKLAFNFPYFIQYLISLFNNAFGYSMRAQFYEHQFRFYFHGFGLWQFATTLALGIISWLKILKNKKYSKLFNIPFFLFLSLILLASGSYPQPRYMFPFIFWLAFGICINFSIINVFKLYFFILIVSLLISIFIFPLQVPVGIDVDNFSNSYFK